MDKQQLMAAGFDVTGAMSRFMNNDAFYEKFLRKFLDEPTFGKLVVAYDSVDMDACDTLAHTLKGVAGNLGFTVLFTVCNDFRMAQKANDSAEIARCFNEIVAEYHRVIDILKLALA